MQRGAGEGGLREAGIHEPNDGIARKVHGNPAVAGRDREGEEHVDIDRLLHIRLPILPVCRPVLRAQEKQTEEEEAEGGTEIEREQRQHRVAQQQFEPAREYLKYGRDVRRFCQNGDTYPTISTVVFNSTKNGVKTCANAREAGMVLRPIFRENRSLFILIRDAPLMIL